MFIAELRLGLNRSVQESDDYRKVAVPEPGTTGFQFNMVGLKVNKGGQ